MAIFRWLTAKVLDYLSKKSRVGNQLSVSAGQEGITVSIGADGETTVHRAIPWEHIRKIVVFKRDVYAHDVICMLIESQQAGVLELDETMQGWEQLVTSLPTYIAPVVPYERWFLRTAFPAFEASPITIYSHV